MADSLAALAATSELTAPALAATTPLTAAVLDDARPEAASVFFFVESWRW
jgi:hypothetical protein